MGVDIHGVVECRLWGEESWASDSPWSVLLELDELRYGRGDHLSWDVLFGYSLFEDIVPLFGARGLPADASSQLRLNAEDPDSAEHDHSYATWAELAAVDWDEPCMKDGRAASHHVERWRRQPDGTLEFEAFVWVPTEVHVAAEARFGEDGMFPQDWPQGTEFDLGEHVYRPVVFTRRQLVFVDSRKWEPIFAVMRALAEIHGDDNVRLIVYFC